MKRQAIGHSSERDKNYVELIAAISTLVRSEGYYLDGFREGRPLSDVFAQVRDGDIVEIYDCEHRQIFRSLNMFRCISYSLDELVTYEWSELYSRPLEAERRQMDLTQKALSERRTVDEALGETHLVSERFSPRRRSAIYESRVISPLFTNGQKTVGYINVLHATPLEN